MGLFDFLRKDKVIEKGVSFDLTNNLDNHTFNLQNDSGLQVGTTSPIYLDTSRGGIIKQYEQIPHLGMCVDKIASMVSKLEWKHYRGENEIENSDLVNLLNNPNPRQNKEDFIKTIVTYYSLYEACILLSDSNNARGLPTVIDIMPFEKMKIVPTGRVYQQNNISDIIKEFVREGVNGERAQSYEPEEIIYIKGRCDSTGIVPKSKITSLSLPLSNIKQALESRNILIKDRGARGVLSPDLKDMRIMSNDEKEHIQNKYKHKYGLQRGKESVIITTTPMKWLPMTENVKNLMLIEEVNESFNIILDVYGLNINMFSNFKSSGLNNNAEAESTKSVYNNTIIPIAENIARTIGNKLLPENETLVPHFDLDVLKENEGLKADIMLKKVTALEKLKNILSEDEFKNVLNDYLNLM